MEVLEGIYRYPKKEELHELVKRPLFEKSEIYGLVENILSNVKTNGDKALIDYALKFDGVTLDNLEVPYSEIEKSEDLCSKKLKEGINIASKTIRSFHLSQFEKPKKIVTADGVVCYRKSLPIENVGLYIPGGRAPLFSTVLMLAVPANVAGCKNIILCTPPNKQGEIDPAILYAAKVANVKHIYKVGGAQAIGAMAFGTESIPKVDKIFGPGNQYVTVAKTLISSQSLTAIDLPAGPSEVLIIADKYCHPDFVAADLLSQAEHGPDSQVILLSDDEDVLKNVKSEIEKQLANAPRREIMEKALSHSRFILFDTLGSAIEFSNFYAPEHLALAVKEPEKLAEKVICAGSVFLGNYSAESFGDYIAGVNHTLPTAGNAHAYSGVSLDSFVKKITFQSINENGVQNVGPFVEVMANAEGLAGHANAVTVRLNNTKFTSKKFCLENLLRENIKRLVPYVCARHEFSGEGIFLDANENSIGSVSTQQVNRYPDPNQKEIKEKLANLKKVSVDNILLTNGSDEAIDLLIRSFCNPGVDEILIMPPTYGMYEVSAGINDVRVVSVNLTSDFQIDKLEVLANITPLTKLMFVCSPNNPSGNLLSQGDIIELIEKFNSIVVVDEAYNDFAKAESFINYLDKYSNLVVLQTFSKAWGMAGARLGMLYASNEIVSVLNKVKPPYNINQFTIQIVSDAFNYLDKKAEMQEQILSERGRLSQELMKFSFVKKVYHSDSNFLLVKCDNALSLYEELKNHSIIVRDRSKAINCDNCLRITVGAKEENDKLLEVCSHYSCS